MDIQPSRILLENDWLVQLGERPWPIVLTRNCIARETQHLILLPHTRQVCEPLRGLFDLICTFWRGLGFESFDSYIDPHPGQEVSLRYRSVGQN